MDNKTIWLIAIAVVTVLAIAVLVRLVIKRRVSTAKQLDNQLKPFVIDQVKTVIIPDGIGGLIEIDRLILTQYGILVIETYALTGHLFGAAKIDQWTQIVNGKSYKFPNPYNHVISIEHAIRLLLPKTPVYGRVVITEDGYFPKNKPDRVSLLTSLQTDLQEQLKSPMIEDNLQVAWKKLLRIARQDGQAVLRETEN